MHLRLLGSAAGGGFPQWNCWCPTCRAARSDPALARPRTQSSVAASADGVRWFLFDASPDVRVQLDTLPHPSLRPGDVRHVPVEGVVLTDAELDHTLGIALLREGRDLHVWATPAVLRTIEEDSSILPVTRAFARVAATELALDEAVALRHRDGSASGLTMRAFPVAGDAPRFASREEPGHTTGVLVRDERTGGSFAFVPGCGALDDALLAHLRSADAVLLDGTFWAEDELPRLGIADRCASEMGHLPISGAAGSLTRLAALPARHRIYTHINNTNPILLERSTERRAVEEGGIVVGYDGLALEL